MKLILANNQSEAFVDFYKSLQAKSPVPFDYASYESLLFMFYQKDHEPIDVINLAANKSLRDYDGVYVNGYLSTYELAATVALCCEAVGIPYANHELSQAPSLSKLTMHAKLAAAHVPTPATIAGTKTALLQAGDILQKQVSFPSVLKRADADRGIDNYMIRSLDEMRAILEQHEGRSMWILQEFVQNDGFYLVSFYSQTPAFCIFRSLQERTDGRADKAHMFKPSGGRNASLIDLAEVPSEIITTCQAAVGAMNRQIASVDCLFDSASRQVRVLEVNYNPQLVTIETFKDVRVQAFLDNLENLGQPGK